MTSTTEARAPIKFGTDGWRAAIADAFTFDNVRLVAQATADYLHGRGQTGDGLVVGYDMRFASEHFAAAVAEVLAANDVHVWLGERAAATPAISYAILTHKAAGGAMITASHNPWTDNGYKYKPEYAGSADPETIAAIEERTDALQAGNGDVRRTDIARAREAGTVEEFDAATPYLRRLGELVDLERLRRSTLSVVADPMYGSGQGYFPRLLGGGSLRLHELNNERNPYFGGINPEPIAVNLGKLMQAVHDEGADVGIAVDGDADRAGLVDEQGRFVPTLTVYGLLVMYLLEKKGWRGPIVKSINTTSMANRLAARYGVEVIETPVGFKYIGPQMRAHDAMFGGEESGGYAFRGHIPERDGTLADLYLLDMLLEYGRPLSQIIDHLHEIAGPSYYERLDVRFPEERREAVMARFQREHPAEIAGQAVEQVDTLDGFKYCLRDGSWLLVRSSGTEPLIRLYAEAVEPGEPERLIAAGKKMAGLE